MLLDPNHIGAVTERFYQFEDGVIRRIIVELGAPPRCSIEIECGDRESVSGWARIILAVTGVTRFAFRYGKTTFEVLSGGVQFAWSDSLVTVMLDAYPDGDSPDLAENAAYVSGSSCDLEVLQTNIKTSSH